MNLFSGRGYLPVRRRHSRLRTLFYRNPGFTLTECIFALGIFTMVLMIFGATIPIAFSASKKSASYTQAAMLCQHKIDQMRQVGAANLSIGPLSQAGIVDQNLNADGSLSFTGVDKLVGGNSNQGYFVAGSAGKIEIGSALSQLGANAPGLDRARQVKVTVTWRAARGGSGSYSVTTIIANTR